ncbi:MAG: tetratricopeptide repeat protein [Thiotrichaceae bacterium]
MDKLFKQGLTQHQQGNFEQANKLYKQVIQANPAHIDALHLSGVIAYEQENYDSAIGLINKALENAPQIPAFHYSIGNAYYAKQDLTQAIRHFQQAVKFKPGYIEAHWKLGLALQQQGALNPAIHHYLEVIRLIPDSQAANFAGVHYNLGLAFTVQNASEKAVHHYQQLMRLNPSHIEGLENLGILLHQSGRYEESVTCYEQALRINPKNSTVYANFGNTLQAQGESEKALVYFKKGIEFAQKDERLLLYQYYLFGLQYNESVTPEKILEESCQWGDEVRSFCAPVYTTHSNTPDPNRRLRIGYLSPDFQNHSVAFFANALLTARNHKEFEIVCFAEISQPDTVTNQFQRLVDAWHFTSGIPDKQLAELIYSEKIDILVDPWAGHTKGNRLLTFAYRPAPLQITLYQTTTGLECMDYRITDSYLDPPDENGANREPLLRLPHSIFCFSPPPEAPAVGSLPCIRNDHITFGSFNNPAKYNPSMLSVWRNILLGIPRSRLILKNSAFQSNTVRNFVLSHFKAAGIADDRIEFIYYSPFRKDHLEKYNGVDIALDPFPYNGTTTTAEALWMGVPVIVLKGGKNFSRTSQSFLAILGLADLTANTPTEYISTAIKLANNTQQLTKLRQSLRQNMKNSPLCDQVNYMHALEKLYRKIWRRWCEQ